MSADSVTNTSSSSTTSRWKYAKIRATAGGPGQKRAEGVLRRLGARDPREPLTITVRYRGGAECWWELRARGRVWRRPGSLALHDVLQDISDGVGGKRPD